MPFSWTFCLISTNLNFICKVCRFIKIQTKMQIKWRILFIDWFYKINSLVDFWYLSVEQAVANWNENDFFCLLYSFTRLFAVYVRLCLQFLKNKVSITSFLTPAFYVLIDFLSMFVDLLFLTLKFCGIFFCSILWNFQTKPNR